MVVIKPPQTREQELEAGRVDVFMTDFPYSRRLLDNADWARLVSPTKPFHALPYAYAVKPGDDAWLKRVDEFVAAIKRDGRLEAAAQHRADHVRRLIHHDGAIAGERGIRAACAFALRSVAALAAFAIDRASALDGFGRRRSRRVVRGPVTAPHARTPWSVASISTMSAPAPPGKTAASRSFKG